jgi:hypothetical protein
VSAFPANSFLVRARAADKEPRSATKTVPLLERAWDVHQPRKAEQGVRVELALAPLDQQVYYERLEVLLVARAVSPSQSYDQR